MGHKAKQRHIDGDGLADDHHNGLAARETHTNTSKHTRTNQNAQKLNNNLHTCIVVNAPESAALKRATG